jgi:glycogen debranching enzyme
LEQSSSDELHSLAFIPKEYAKLIPFDAVQERAKDLITPVGIACTPKDISDKLTDTYHGYKVWIFEQAVIHYGCTKFGLKDMAHATTGSTSYIETGHELLSVTPTIAPLGNSHQLWSVAAKIYFSESQSLRQVDWL